ncbi:hypothetical protein [Acidovorax sp. sic0104]|uniref:hypothetical protein n=1 Tax=Acidovorax sp. sic0104 TaxID=2854784 RepID=UPI001C4921A6|nr:hypothetical protein [Acidovorax sp. sic0104]MBV7542081.1 hypothetical protein [Acidovorax sp. sic0104]
MAKLTKDQKREKKKREERKLKLRREHEENRHFKKVDGLMMAIAHAMQGSATQQELNDAVLRLGGGLSVAASEAKSIFTGPQWNYVKAATTEMVAMLQAEEYRMYSGLGLQGRIYINGDDPNTVFHATSFPLFAMVTCNWHPEEVVWRSALDLEPEPTRGAYFFGVEIRDLALHFAIASTARESDTPEVYFVSPSGWHRLDLTVWRDELWPCLARVGMSVYMTQGPSDIQIGVIQVYEDSSDEELPQDDLSALDRHPMNDRGRTSVRCLGAELLHESEMLVMAATNAVGNRTQEQLTEAWSEGFDAREDEIAALQEKLEMAKIEAAAMRDVLLKQAAGRPVETLPPACPAPSQPATALPSPKPLHERMGSLLGY